VEIKLDFVLFYTCILDLWITIQPDDGLCEKAKDVAGILINIRLCSSVIAMAQYMHKCTTGLIT